MHKITLLLILLTSSLSHYGQEAKQPKISFGIKAGPGMSKYNIKQNQSNYTTRTEWKLSYHAGLFARIPVAAGGKFAIQPEILYSRNGSRISETYTSIDYITGRPVSNLRVYKQVINYINVPLMLQFGLSSGVYAEAG